MRLKPSGFLAEYAELQHPHEDSRYVQDCYLDLDDVSTLRVEGL